MGKIILGSIVLILGVLALNSYWSPGEFKINPVDSQKLIQNFQEAQKSFPQKVIEGARGAASGVQNRVTSFFARKAGREIVGVIKSLPPEQQKEIKNTYCSNATL